MTYARGTANPAHLLTDEELDELLDLGDSLFYNLDLVDDEQRCPAEPVEV